MTFERLLLLASLVIGGLRPAGMLGPFFVYPWLGIFPGLALVLWRMPRDPASVRWTVALCISPLISTVAAWALIRAGFGVTPAALLVSMAGWIGCAVAVLRTPQASDPSREGVPGAVVAWGIGLAAILLAIPVINPYIFVRGDSWIHGGIVAELLERGFPPEDARMAGLRLNYVWFFNFFIALLTGIHGQDLFRFMTLFNVANGLATVMLTGLIARRLWGGTRAPLAAAVLLTLGLNAGAFLLWPFNLLRAMTGDVQGTPEIQRQLGNIAFGTARIIYDLRAPLAEMASFLDKLLVGTAVNFAYLQMSFFLWALMVWLGDGRRAALAWLAVAASGMMLFHSVVGLSVLPVALSTLGLAWILRGRWEWLPSRGALAWAIAAGLAGMLATLPYMRSITAGWAPEKAGFEHRFLQFNESYPWTLLSSCFFPLLLLRKPLAAIWREQRPLPLLLAAYAAGMAVFACFVHLPAHNSIKFVYEFFTACVLLAAPAFAAAAEHAWRRRRGWGMALALLFIVPTALTVHGYLVDPTGKQRPELNPKPGEENLYVWLRAGTPRDAVVVDRNYRDLIAVKGRRRLFLGTDQPPDLAAFPAPEMRRRQSVMTDLYGPMSRPDSVVAGLRLPGRTVFVVFRPEDGLASPAPWNRLVAAAPGSMVAYDLDGYVVVRMAKEGGL